MYVDFKVTTWFRAELEDLTDKQIEEIKEKVIKGELNRNELFYDDLVYSWEQLLEDETQVEPKDNEGYSTIDFYDDEGNVIASNGVYL